MKLLGVVGVLACAALSNAEGIAEPADSKVHIINGDTFDRFIKKHPIVVMEFYAPWCGHCQNLAPVYREAASAIAEQDLPKRVVFAKFNDGDEYNRAFRAGAEDMFNYTSYPTILVFKDKKIKVANKEHWTHKYRGRRWQYYGGGRDKADDFVFYLSAIANEKDPFDEERKARPGFYKKGGKHETTWLLDLEPDGDMGFNKTILEDTRNNIWIVEFYSDRCPYCNSLAPEITKAAEKVQKEKDWKVRFAAVNSRVYNEIAEAHEVTSWPWVASFYHGAKLQDMAGLGGWESVYNWANKMYSDYYSTNPPKNRFLEGPWVTGWDQKTPEELAAERAAREKEAADKIQAEKDKLEALIVEAVKLNVYSPRAVDVLRKKLADGGRTLQASIDLLQTKLQPVTKLKQDLKAGKAAPFPSVSSQTEQEQVKTLLAEALKYKVLTAQQAQELEGKPAASALAELNKELAPIIALFQKPKDEL